MKNTRPARFSRCLGLLLSAFIACHAAASPEFDNKPVLSQRPIDPTRWPEVELDGQWQRVWAPPEKILVFESDEVEPEGMADFASGKGKATLVFPDADMARMTLDYGRTLYGEIVLELDCDAPVSMTVRPSETRNIYVDTVCPNVSMEFNLIFEAGSHEWRPEGLVAFRYLFLTLLSEEKNAVTVKKLVCRLRARAARYVGSFECSEPLLNRAWEIGAYTAHLCMQDLYWCDIKRERMLWGGDFQLHALGAYAAFDERENLRESLEKVAVKPGPDGAAGRAVNNIPAYSAAWVLSAHDYWMHTGDTDTLQALFPVVAGTLVFLDRMTDRESGLVGDSHGLWFWFGHHLPGAPAGACRMHMQALYHAALLAGSDMASALGLEDEARKYAESAARLRAAANLLLWDEETGGYADYIVPGMDRPKKFQPAVNGAALACGLADPEQSRRAIEAVVPNPWLPQPKDAFAAYWTSLGLLKQGFIIEGLGVVSCWWGRMAARPEVTTFWEYWEAIRPTGIEIQHLGFESFCHSWNSGVCYLLSRHVLGLGPAEPGFARVLVAPNPGPLSWVKGAMPTPAGAVAAETERIGAGADIRIKAEIPEGLKARIGIPIEDTRIVAVTVNGQTVFENDGFKPAPGLVEKHEASDMFLFFDTCAGGSLLVEAQREQPGAPRKLAENRDWAKPTLPQGPQYRPYETAPAGGGSPPSDKWIREWIVLAPIPAPLDHDFGLMFEDSVDYQFVENESTLRLKPGDEIAGLRAAAVRTDDENGLVDFDNWFPNVNCAAAYCAAYIWAEEEMKNVRILAGSDDYLRVYLNGETALIANKRLRGTKPDEDSSGPVALRKGWNIVLAKVLDVICGWSFCLRFVDEQGKPVFLIQTTRPLPQ